MLPVVSASKMVMADGLGPWPSCIKMESGKTVKERERVVGREGGKREGGREGKEREIRFGSEKKEMEDNGKGKVRDRGRVRGAKLCHHSWQHAEGCALPWANFGFNLSFRGCVKFGFFLGEANSCLGLSPGGSADDWESCAVCTELSEERPQKSLGPPNQAEVTVASDLCFSVFSLRLYPSLTFTQITIQNQPQI